MSGIIGDNLGRSGGLIKAAAGGGKIGQVIHATDSTIRTITSSSYVDMSSTLTADITLSSTSSRVFLLATIATQGQNKFLWTFFRDATNLAADDSFSATQVVNLRIGVTLSHIDSPASTSAITYQVMARSPGTTGTTYLNSADAGERETSTLTVWEILAWYI